MADERAEAVVRLFRHGVTSAPTVLLLHGVGTDHTTWDPQVQLLGDRYDVLTPDLPGTTDDDTDPMGPERAAEAIALSLDAHNVSRAHVVGLSLGAMVAAVLADIRPDLVRSLVLSGIQVRPPAIAMAVQSTVMRAIPYRRLGAESRDEKWRVIRAIDAVRGADLRPSLANISSPTLVLCGQKDRPNHRAARTAASLINGAELRFVPHADHQWNEQQPQRFTDTITTFADEHAD